MEYSFGVKELLHGILELLHGILELLHGILELLHGILELLHGILDPRYLRRVNGFFTNSPQNKNANIANFVLAMSLEINWTNEVCNLEM